MVQAFEERFRRLGAHELRLLRLVAIAQTDAGLTLVTVALDVSEERVVSAQATLLDGP